MQLAPSATPQGLSRPLLGVLLALAATAFFSVAAPAGAKPVAPGAAPLWLSSVGIPTTTCPKADDLTGATRRAYVATGNNAKQRTGRAVRVVFGDALISQPIVLFCDPELRAQQRFMSGITGQSALTTTDQVFWGQRSLAGSAEDGGASGLRSGDQLALPAAGAGATLDVTVAAGDGTSTVRLPSTGSAPTGLRVTGSTAAPSIVVSDATGERTVPVPVPAAARFAIKVTRAGNVISGRIRANEGAILLFGSDDDGDARIGRASGRQTLRAAIKGKESTVFAVVYDPATRAAWTVSCKAPRGKAVRCKKPGRGLSGFIEVFFAGFAKRGGPIHRLAAPPSGHAATATPLAPATITKIGDDSLGRNEISLLAGDLNGDGRPDAWLRRDSGSSAALLVSTPAGAWQRVRVSGLEPAGPFDKPALPDLDGDGRAEIVAPKGVLITDAFAGPTLPATINVGAKRQPSVRDLLPGSEDELFGSSFVATTPSSSLADITGDGRPELLLDGSELLATLPSEALPAGRLAHRADVVPAGLFAPTLSAINNTNREARLAEERSQAENDARYSLGHRVVAGRLFTISPVNRSAVSTTPQPIVLEERRADGAVIASRTFSAAGWPILLDVDPVSGDALVQMAPAKRCPKVGEPAERGFNTRRCTDHILRVDARGALLSDVTDDRASDEPVSAVFAPDGADPDDRLEVLMALTGGMNPGELKLLGSTASGPAKLDALPTLDLEGKRRDDLVEALEAVVLPNGSRWAVITTSPVTSETEEASGELLIVAPK